MPKEALLFIVIIGAIVTIAIMIGIWMSRKDETETKAEDIPEPFPEDFPEYIEEETADTLADNTTARLQERALEADLEIARKQAELARLQYEIEQAKQPQPKPKKKKKHGCFSTICATFLLITIVLVSGNESDNNGANSTYTNRPKATATATVRPDYYSMPIKDVVELIADAAQTNDCATRSVKYYSDLIEIEVNMKVIYNAQSMLNSAISYSLKAFPMFFEHPESPQVRFTFWEPGRDKYGNPIDMCTITMRLERETYEKINWKFYSQNRYTHAPNYLNILDGHSLHKSYKEVLEK